MITKNEEKWLILNSKLQKAKIIKAFQVFRENNLEPILIKGFAIERLYNKEKPRISFDIDLAFSKEDFVRAKKLLKTKLLQDINIDLHRELRHLDTSDWETLYQNSILVEVEQYQIRVLSEEDHLRVLCVHWLTDGGENKDKLFDIYFAVSNRTGEFDWEKCFKDISNKRRIWIIYTIGLAHIYLDLDISDLPFRETALKLPKWLTYSLESIWNRKYPFIPLDACYTDRKMFLYQLKLRFPPNPLMAIIGVEGDFDKGSRLLYQAKYIFKRSIPSIKSYIRHTLIRQKKPKNHEE